MAQGSTIDFSRAMPLLPVSGCVLLPHCAVPLHVHEPCRRHLVQDAVDSNGLIAVALLACKTRRGERRPALRPHVCVGYVVRHQRLPQGRYNLLLQGVCRARICREVNQQPYRAALLEPTERPPMPLELDLADHRHRIESLLNDALLRELMSVSAIHNCLSAEIPTAALVDMAAMTVWGNVDKRYAMLAEPDPLVRAVWLEQWLRDTRQTLAAAERFRGEAVSGGLCLN